MLSMRERERESRTRLLDFFRVIESKDLESHDREKKERKICDLAFVRLKFLCEFRSFGYEIILIIVYLFLERRNYVLDSKIYVTSCTTINFQSNFSRY